LYVTEMFQTLTDHCGWQTENRL